eukprot:4017459-Prymnesium_polylepis.1
MLQATTCSQTAGGVSSFGLGGTIAHVVILAMSDAGDIDIVQQPLIYRRCSFPWRDSPHPLAQQLVALSD